MIKDVGPLLKECEETLAELKKMGNMEVACYVQGFINSINKLPDVEQRPHGEWIFVHPLQEDDCGAYMCSVCKNGEFGIDPEIDKYCYNCGADMRKEGDKE